MFILVILHATVENCCKRFEAKIHYTKTMKSLFGCLLALCWVLNLQAQVAAVTNVSPEEAVAALVGPSLQVSNISFTGDSMQIGTYENAVGDFPFANGIILSTSHAGSFSPDSTSAEPATPVNTEDDLLSIANSVPPLIGQAFTVADVNDVAILEFDFVASCPQLTFQYAFGSDEYLTFVNTQYNDVFAFLISGPGISGPYAAPPEFPDGAANLAIVPGSNPPLPITISSVNNQLNTQYYIDNPGNTNNTSVSCTGYTDSLVVLSDLVCGATYHMKLAIADGSDNSLKSIVVFKPQSFECFEPALALEPDNPFLVGEQSLYEGCVDGIIRITPPSCSSDSVTIYLDYSGSAIMDVDYEGSGDIALPDSVRLAGSDTLIYVTILTDTQIEVLETLQVTASYMSLQDELITTTSTINVFDYDFPTLAVDDLFICEQETAVPTITNGLEPFTYQWDDLSTEPTKEYTTADSGAHTLVITDVCGHDTTTTFFISYSPFIVPFPQDTFFLCEATLPLVVAPEDQVNPLLEYWWIEFPERDTILQQFRALKEGRYHLIINDTSCNRIDSAVFFVAPKIVLQDAEYTTCWEQINELNPLTANPDGSGFPQQEFWRWKLQDGLVDTLSYEQSYSFYAPVYNGIYEVIATQNEIETGCSNRDTAFIEMYLIPCSLVIPNIMTPNGDGNNDTFIGQSNVLTAGISADVIVFNRWGNVVYENKRYVGDWGAQELPDGMYYYIVKITGNGLNDLYEGDLTILR